MKNKGVEAVRFGMSTILETSGSSCDKIISVDVVVCTQGVVKKSC